MKELTKNDIVIEVPVLNKRIARSSSLCAPVAVSLALDKPFDEAYNLLSEAGLQYGMLMISNRIISKVLEHKYNIYRGPFQKINNPGSGYATVGDVVLGYYAVFGVQGYLISSNVGSVGHIQYVKGLTVYDGVIAADGTLNVPKSREIVDHWLQREAVNIWIPKTPGEPIYCDPRVELFIEVKLCSKFYGLFGKFHIDQRRLSPSFYYYEVEGDEQGSPEKIVNVASNNWIGCFITKHALLKDEDRGLKLCPENDWELVRDEITLDEFKCNHRHDT